MADYGTGDDGDDSNSASVRRAAMSEMMGRVRDARETLAEREALDDDVLDIRARVRSLRARYHLLTCFRSLGDAMDRERQATEADEAIVRFLETECIPRSMPPPKLTIIRGDRPDEPLRGWVPAWTQT